ncbi:ABC transporter permease [Aestuariispira insulae]|uniref:Nucleoside ABC transporter membrane protein n=1 Tax=Aestuariispira insulae TaxID=1461337 RepID=A0A3D9HN26_9PROT|nr:ABC transporter permease [Aestuariispira insulae]RED50868.1 nucleoside ABC transporter membrane protein [Aestuariispira insulae]
MSTKVKKPLPVWADVALIPLINILLALFVAGLIVLAIGEDPFEALEILILGAFGYEESLGYTLYYTTNFIFTGLAVAVAFHASLFNIGGEGQAYIGGLGVGLILLALDGILPFWMLLPLAIMAAALFGTAWVAVPAYLQAYRGSHIVITTIMFNFIAYFLMNYLLVDVIKAPAQMSPESRVFADNAHMPFMHEILGWFGIETAATPLNGSLFWAVVCCIFVWIFIWRTRWGYMLRTVGQNESAAQYAGIDSRKIVMVALGISGALAGFVGMNEVMGVHHKVLLNFVAGYGFTGIAVSLMGRNHPVGIVLASLLFGILYQGGAELAFEIPAFSREFVVAIQGLIILFCGALTYMCKPWIEGLFYMLQSDPKPAEKEA